MVRISGHASSHTGITHACANTKKIMRDSLEKKFIQTYEDEANTQNSILGNDEFKEGVAAFFEKRKPVFK